MKLIKLFTPMFVVLLSSILFGQSEKVNDECANCHSQLGDELQKPADLYQNDLHSSLGFSCAVCHGGESKSDDMDVSMNKSKGFIGVPKRSIRYEVCIKCHADDKKMHQYGFKKSSNQYEKLKTSVHFRPSANNQGPIADCITCHGVHNIVRVTSPASPVYPTKIVNLCGSCHSNASYMKNYNPALPVDQVTKYRTSTHGIKNSKGDAVVAQCASCHGSHEIKKVNDSKSLVYPTNIPKVCSECHSDKNKMAVYKIPTDQYDSYIQSAHGIALLEKGDVSAPTCNDCHGNHGAVPPGVESISKVCGSCHSLNMELFEKSVHKKAFDDAKIPECETCHSNHKILPVSDDLIGVESNSTCVKCHESNDKGFAVAKHMRGKIEKLKANQIVAEKLLKEAAQKGMDVSDASFSLKDVRQKLIETRTTIHSFDQEKFDEVIKQGFEITKEAKTTGTQAIDNYYFRRKGLALSTLLVTLLVAGLYLYIKKIEKKRINQ